MASWGESLKEYVHEKCHTAPAIPTEPRYTRKSKATLHPESVVPRTFDIISNDLHDVTSRERAKQEELQQVAAHVKRGVTKEMRAGQHGYNIISMQPRYGMKAEVVEQLSEGARPRAMGKRSYAEYSEYNVVTMQPNYQYVLDREAKEQEQLYAKKAASRRTIRQTDIISQRYRVDHEARAQAEDDALRHRLHQVAEQSSSYNPISCKYRRVDHEEREQAKQAAKEETQRELVQNHTYKASPLVSRSEGHAYDILGDHIHNPQYVYNLQRKEATGIPQRAALRQQWEQQRDVDEVLRDHESKRALARVSAERTNEQLRRGHELLSNKPFGLSREEEAAVGGRKAMEPAVLEATFRPLKPMKVLEKRSVMDTLRSAASANAEWTSTEVLREAGPRTTQERVFHTAPSAPALAVSTYTGRTEHLLPKLDNSQKFGRSTNSVRDFY